MKTIMDAFIANRSLNIWLRRFSILYPQVHKILQKPQHELTKSDVNTLLVLRQFGVGRAEKLIRECGLDRSKFLKSNQTLPTGKNTTEA